MKQIKITAAIILLFMQIGMTGAYGQDAAYLTLDTCRARALRANLGLRRAEAKVDGATALERAALWQMLPKVSAAGGYFWTARSIQLLSEEQQQRLTHLGDEVEADIGQALHNELDPLPLLGGQIADRLSDAVAASGLADRFNNMGEEIVQGLETDTRRMGGVMVSLNQPLYMGGKLLALHRTAALARSLAGVELTQQQRKTLVEVDEAYWQVVSLQHKQALAQRYAALLDTLRRNVELLEEADMATRGDVAQVRVKQNEAQMKLTQATNGLRLSKMLLAQRCGMPLQETGWQVGDEEWKASGRPLATTAAPEGRAPEADAGSLRPEVQMLRIADSMAHQGERVAASTLKPNIAFTGGYLMTNPNLFDGFRNEWGGTWTAGIVVGVPLVHPAGVYALRAAKAKRREVQYQLDEAQQMIALQVDKLRCELEVAYKHLDEAQSALDAAEENLTLADESFRAGMCSSGDVLAAQTAWLQAEGEVIDAHIDIEMGKVYLQQALGR